MSPRHRTKGRKGWPDRMTARPRKAKDGKIRVYYGWEDPRTGKERSLEATDNFALAKTRSEALNLMWAQETNAAFLQRAVTAPEKKPVGHTWGEWCDRYMAVLQTTRQITEVTIRNTRSQIKRLRSLIGNNLPLLDVTVERMADALTAVREEGKLRSAQALRSRGVDMINEAKREGWFPADRANPAELTRNPEVPVNRSRLSLAGFKLIAAKADEKLDPWAANSQWLALVTGQRREDVCEFQFRRGRDWESLLDEFFEARRQKRRPRLPHPYPHVQDGVLWVVQQKKGKLIKIPIDLRIEAAEMSVSDAINRCRDSVASRFMIHHTKRRTKSDPGDQVFIDTLTKAFAKARDLSGITWAGDPPTFHEIRSLAARLYTEERGADFAQGLLGHSDARTTATYRDTRGHEWLEVKVS